VPGFYIRSYPELLGLGFTAPHPARPVKRERFDFSILFWNNDLRRFLKGEWAHADSRYFLIAPAGPSLWMFDIKKIV
jgi:hypothetical protein